MADHISAVLCLHVRERERACGSAAQTVNPSPRQQAIHWPEERFNYLGLCELVVGGGVSSALMEGYG